MANDPAAIPAQDPGSDVPGPGATATELPSRPPPRRRGSPRALWFAIAGVLVAAAAVAAVGLLARARPGAASGEDLVRGVVAAMSQGDADRMLQLSDPRAISDAAFDCSERDARAGRGNGPGDLDQQRDALWKSYARWLDTTKGLAITVHGITEAELKNKRDTSHAAGDTVSPGCVAKTAVRGHRYRATLQLQGGDKQPAEYDVAFKAVEAGGRFYLLAPPQLDSAGDDVAKIERMADAMCQCPDAACARKLLAETAGRAAPATPWPGPEPLRAPSAEDHKRRQQAAERLAACSAKLATAATPAGSPAAR